MRWRLTVLATLTLLAGCHSLTLMGPNGETGTGTAHGVGGSGSLDITLAGTHYHGHWVNAVSGGAESSFGQIGRTTYSGTTLVGGDGTGNALLHSDDGKHSLRCYFTVGGFSNTGVGKCLDETGKVYDLQIG